MSEVKQIIQTIGLLNSMVKGGEQHSQQSINAVSDAIGNTANLGKENTTLKKRIEMLRTAMKKGIEEYYSGFGGEADMCQTIKKALDDDKDN